MNKSIPDEIIPFLVELERATRVVRAAGTRRQLFDAVIPLREAVNALHDYVDTLD